VRLEVTRKSDLAVRVLRVLADEGARVRGQQLAEAVDSTTGFIPQVLNPLVRAGWVRSEPGPTGGYSLVVDLSTVSVLAVIEAIEGPTDSGRCVLADRPCRELGHCALHEPWTRARNLLLDELDLTPVSEALIAVQAP
jgi:Rrf2 family protein